MEIFPVWEDLFFEYQGDVLEYRITIKDGDEIFHGRAVKSPKDRVIRIRLNDCCESFLNSILGEEAFREAESIDRAFPLDAYREFALDIIEGDIWETAYEWAFTNDYSYDYKEPQGSYSEPINGHCATGQLLPYSHLVTGDTESVCYEGCGGVFFTITSGVSQDFPWVGGQWRVWFSTNLSAVWISIDGSGRMYNRWSPAVHQLGVNGTYFSQSHVMQFYSAQNGGILLGEAFASVQAGKETSPTGDETITITEYPSAVPGSGGDEWFMWEGSIRADLVETLSSSSTQGGTYDVVYSGDIDFGAVGRDYLFPANDSMDPVWYRYKIHYKNLPDVSDTVEFMQYPSVASEYLTIMPKSTITLAFLRSQGNRVDAATLPHLQYSIDSGATWNTLPTFQTGDTVAGVQFYRNDVIWLRGDVNGGNWWGHYEAPSTPSVRYILSTTGTFDVKGNILSVIYGSNFVSHTGEVADTRGFAYFFSETGVVSAKDLILPPPSGDTYTYFFQDCTSLTEAPELHSAVASNCYYGMFAGCTALEMAPELPATTLAYGCYGWMFYNTGIYDAPTLPATTLEVSCYEKMFRGCSNLGLVMCFATDISALSCTDNWLSNVPASGTFVKAAGTTWPTGDSGIPSGWTVVDAD